MPQCILEASTILAEQGAVTASYAPTQASAVIPSKKTEPILIGISLDRSESQKLKFTTELETTPTPAAGQSP
jgi:hypothetical protein